MRNSTRKLIKLWIALMLSMLTSSAFAVTYHIVGNGSSTTGWCCGKNWNPSGCPMDGGSYSVTVPAGTYEFKITNGSWSQDWGYNDVDAENSTHGYKKNDANNVMFVLNREANIEVTFDGTSIVLTSNVPFVTSTSSWTVVGNPSLMGSSWDYGDSRNDMMPNDDESLFTLTRNGVTLTAGTYLYAAVENHHQATYVTGNKSLSIETDGTYDIVFTLDPNTKDLTANATLPISATEETEADAIPTTYKIIENNEIIIVTPQGKFNMVGIRK